MAGSNKIQIFDANVLNLLNDAAYGASAFRQSGAVSGGICPDPDFNKFGYQISILISALAQSLFNKGIGTDVDGSFSDASFSNLVAAFAKIMTTADMSPYAKLLSPAFTGVPSAPDIGAGTFSQLMTANRLTAVLGAYYTAAQINSLLAPLASQGFVIGGAGFAAGGWIKAPTWWNATPWILQWGQGFPSANTISVNFPIVFPHACLLGLGTTKAGTQTFSVTTSNAQWFLTGNGNYALFALGY